MGCIYSTRDGGYCSISSTNNPVQGCAESEYNEDEEMYPCAVEDDPIPSDNCDHYESDSSCFQCGADYNAGEECICDEEE